MKIPILNRGGVVVAFTVVDKKDYDFLKKHVWRLAKADSGLRYAARGVWVNGKRRTLLVHREILGLTNPSDRVDHKNGDGLYNRRGNLRMATHAQNMQNRKVHRNSQSGHRGVYWHKGCKQWAAEIRKNGRKVWRKYFRNLRIAIKEIGLARRNILPYSINYRRVP